MSKFEKKVEKSVILWELLIFLLNQLIMIGFLGEFEATLDAKGRFLFPAGFKKQFPKEEVPRFVINRGLEACLTLYPLKTWEPLFRELSLKNDFNQEVRDFRRKFFSGATYVDSDAAGRILIPPNLKAYANLQKDIVLVSAIDKIEIWDSNKYKQFFDSFSPEAFSDLAQKVMGSAPDASNKNS